MPRKTPQLDKQLETERALISAKAPPEAAAQPSSATPAPSVPLAMMELASATAALAGFENYPVPRALRERVTTAAAALRGAVAADQALTPGLSASTQIEMSDELRQTFDGIQQGFDEVSKSFDGLVARLDGFEQRLDAIQDRIEALPELGSETPKDLLAASS